jgi:TRAP-type C4-dicarboxylate transport system permease small subunit
MRRIIGIALLAICLIAGVILLATGNLYSSRVWDVASGGTPSSNWQVSVVEFDLNWIPAIILALAFVAGLTCVIVPERRNESGKDT